MSKVNSIEELKQKCAEKNMPLEKMRFFIGKDMKEPKCFGVYQDETTGDWIVYKNKANGERAIRYSGPDEARAAQEIWDKIGDEIRLRKERYGNPYEESAYRSAEPKEPSILPGTPMSSLAGIANFIKEHIALSVFVFGLAAYLILQVIFPSQKRGYYQVGDAIYYCLSDSWYLYDDGWVVSTMPEGNVDDYYLGSSYSQSYGTSNFENTPYYEEYLKEKEDNDNDDDYDYDFDTWDAGDTDWDSDW